MQEKFAVRFKRDWFSNFKRRYNKASRTAGRVAEELFGAVIEAAEKKNYLEAALSYDKQISFPTAIPIQSNHLNPCKRTQKTPTPASTANIDILKTTTTISKPEYEPSASESKNLITIQSMRNPNTGVFLPGSVATSNQGLDNCKCNHSGNVVVNSTTRDNVLRASTSAQKNGNQEKNPKIIPTPVTIPNQELEDTNFNIYGGGILTSTTRTYEVRQEPVTGKEINVQKPGNPANQNLIENPITPQPNFLATPNQEVNNSNSSIYGNLSTNNLTEIPDTIPPNPVTTPNQQMNNPNFSTSVDGTLDSNETGIRKLDSDTFTRNFNTTLTSTDHPFDTTTFSPITESGPTDTTTDYI